MLKNKIGRRKPAGSSPKRLAVNNYYGRRRGQPADSPFESVVRAPRLRQRLARLLEGLIVLALLGGIVYSLIVSGHSKVIVNDVTFHSAADYQHLVDSKLSAIGNRNKVTFDQAAVVLALRRSYPEVQNASIELPIFGHQPVVRLKVATPALFLSANQADWLISSDGVAVGPKAQYHHLESLSQLIDQSGLAVGPGRRILNSHDVWFIQTVLKQMKVYDVPAKQLVLPNALRQLNVYVGDAPYYVKFFTGGDPNLQVGQLVAVRQRFKVASAPGQYLDVRVDGKVFYK